MTVKNTHVTAREKDPTGVFAWIILLAVSSALITAAEYLFFHHDRKANGHDGKMSSIGETVLWNVEERCSIWKIMIGSEKPFHEIRAAQVEQEEKAWEGFQGLHWLLFVPMLLIRIFCWMRRTCPQVQKKYGGTVGITAVGMFGKGSGWGIPINDHTIDITLGCIVMIEPIKVSLDAIFK